MKIFYDVDTQNDFMQEDGALPVPLAKIIKLNLKKLTEYAFEKNIPVVGSVDLHYGNKEFADLEKELKRNGGFFPDHCMKWTKGQEKIEETIMKRDNLYIPNYRVNIEDIGMSNWLNSYPYKSNNIVNVYFEKQTFDVFDNFYFETFIKNFKITEAVVYGVATDYCVKDAVLGLINHGVKVKVVKDAIKGIDEKTEQQAIVLMKKAGADFVKLNEIICEVKK